MSLIRPQQKLRDKLFYNNILLILVVFSLLCFVTSISLFNKKVTNLNYSADGKVLPTIYNEPYEGTIWGPIKVTNRPLIYKVTAYFHGDNFSNYLVGEVLDEDKETLYEFGKDLWHESGYDSEGYWSESDRKMTAYLTFKEKGIYYIQFGTESVLAYTADYPLDARAQIKDIEIKIEQVKNSYIPHSKAGSLVLLLVLILFCWLNWVWVKEKWILLNEKLEEMSDD